MDFLDPKRKKAHRTRLLIGYMLMAVAIAMGTLILLFSAYGYDINRKTGELIQNGIIFLDSQPGSATVYLNGEVQRNRTATRIAVPAGMYSVRMAIDGYRDWTRTIQLEGGQIERLVYPLLIPKTLKPADVQLYATTPPLGSTSPDRHWLLAQQASTFTFDQYDLSSPQNAPVPLQIPAAALTDATKVGTLAIVEWSNDNRHVVIEHSYDDKHEFLLFDREQPASTLNITKLFGVAITQVELRNKRPDQMYIYDASGGTVRLADTKNRTISAPMLSNVLTFKTYNDDLVFYVATDPTQPGKTFARILEGTKSYTLRQLASNTTYVLDLAQYSGQWYYVVGAASENQEFIYHDPLSALKSNDKTAPAVAAVVREANPRFVSFSANTRFIAIQSGNKLVAFDVDEQRQFRYQLEQAITLENQIKWMDGYRLSYTVDNKMYIVDFDGTNRQMLGDLSGPQAGPFFDRDYTTMFSLSPSVTVPSRTALVETSLQVK